MRKRIFSAILLSSLFMGTSAILPPDGGTGGEPCTPTPENLAARARFADAKFGIFLHWGLYSMFGQGEWYMTNQDIDSHEYAKAANAFYPHDFDAAEWVRAIKGSGARYITFTTRHHEGFSMWDTKQSDYNIMHTPYGRDVLRQLSDECRRQSLPLHLYYSHLDWTREDYPLGRTGLGTKRKNASKQGNWPSYYDFMNRQLRELLTEYGPVGCIWFDGWWDHDEDSIPFDWQLEAQYRLIHELQPACLVGNNHHQTPFPGEDIQIFERDVPGENTAGLSGQSISRLPLETCQTMNGMWGYKVKDQDYKSTCELVRLLVRTSGKGANLLLNIGPQPDGKLPAAALARLDSIGRWLDRYGESIYGTTAGGVGDGENVVSTKKDGTLYLHFLSDSIRSMDLALPKKPRSVRTLVGDMPLSSSWKKGILHLEFTPVRDAWDSVVAVEGVTEP
ncbi:MAG: alpha-L-fucosidase [Alloprevotella sp.]|nr:alpha-L-fucosidase [Alloprevotella sp.]